MLIKQVSLLKLKFMKMNSLQDYIDKYRTIGKNLGYTGQSIEVLVQLLANASYISEVENVSYMQESSLEKCSLINSKIQHCVDNMYSVYRGSCPRVLLKVRPTKYLNLAPYQEVITSQTFKIYYLGYYDSSESQFKYSAKTFYPSEDESQIIICLLAKEIVEESWTINSFNTYYVDCLENNLSEDAYVTIEGNIIPRTRLFSDHILNHSVFDLTLPNFGSRLYVADFYKDTVGRSSAEIEGMTTNSNISAVYFKYNELADYNSTELERIKLLGSEFVSFSNEELKKLTNNSSTESLSETAEGIYYLSEVKSDGLNTIHYKANRDRYVNSILRSNSDIGTVLEETYPDTVKSGGTSYSFSYGNNSTSTVTIYYIPNNEAVLLSSNEISSFKAEKRAYYVITDNIDVVKGNRYTAIFNISIELYNNSSDDWSVLIGENILKSSYQRKFNINFSTSTVEEIKSLISKLSNVKKINNLSISVIDSNNVAYSGTVDSSTSYYDIKYSISTTVTQTNTDF